MKNNRNIVVIILGAILLAGIASAVIFGGRKGSQELITEPASTEVSSVDVEETEASKEGSNTGSEELPAPTEVILEEATPLTPRTGLESTDPAVVNLASGDIQLVEFFAFW